MDRTISTMTCTLWRTKQRYGPYLSIFKQVFEETQHGAHYQMMMGPEDSAAALDEDATVAGAGAGEAGRGAPTDEAEGRCGH